MPVVTDAPQELDALKALSQGMEHRVYGLNRLEIRALEDGEAAPRIKGHAAIFDQPSEPLNDGWGFAFREQIAPGAFKKTLKEADVRALWNHDANYVLGRNRANTLQLREDSVGLAVDIQPPETTWATDLITTMKRGDVDQMSFAFQTVKDRWEEDRDADGNLKLVTRTLLEVRLFDVSVVTFPAYPQTDAQVQVRCLHCGGPAPYWAAPPPHNDEAPSEPIATSDHSAEPGHLEEDRSDDSPGAEPIAPSDHSDEPVRAAGHSLSARHRRLELALKV